MRTLLLISVILLTSCSHHRKKLFKDAHVAGTCSEKIKDINPPQGQDLIDLSKQMTAGTVSIAIAGLGAATDALVIVLTSPVTKVSVCIVTIAALTDGRSHHGANLDICGMVAEPSYNPKLTQKALKQTKSWRCPNLDYISEGLRDVARCYKDNDQKDKARLQLEGILKDKTISDCISEAETEKIKNEIEILNF